MNMNVNPARPSAATLAALRPATPSPEEDVAPGGAAPGGVRGGTTSAHLDRLDRQAREEFGATGSLVAEGGAANDPEADGTSFERRFAELAADPDAFHALMRTVYGTGYDAGAAEGLRARALEGDFGRLPEVRYVGADVLGGAHGAYDAASDTVYVDESLRGTALADEVLAEEIGHALDVRLNGGADTAGDEGELFRRLLSGEALGAEEIDAIRAEDDTGTIVVDGETRAVEFWNPFKWVKEKVIDPVVDFVVEEIVEPALSWTMRGLHELGLFIDKVTGASDERSLTTDEIDYLRTIYGDSIDYSAIRIQRGGIKDLIGMRSNTVGHDVFMADGLNGDEIYDAAGNLTADGRAWLETLGHEAMHVWQYEHQGSNYIGEALLAQWVGDGYDLERGLDEGKTFEEMNPEQQGVLAENIGLAILANGSGVLTKADFEAAAGFSLSDPQWQVVQDAHATLLAG